MLNSQDIEIQFIQKPRCHRADGSLCPCTKKLQNRLFNTISTWLSRNDHDDIIFQWACGKADSIIEISFPTLDELSQLLHKNPHDIIRQSKPSIQEAIDQAYGWKQDPYLIATNQKRDASNSTLTLTFQRGVKKFDISNFLDI